MGESLILLEYGPLGIALFCLVWIVVAAVFTAIWKTKLENRVYNLEKMAQNRKDEIHDLDEKIDAVKSIVSRIDGFLSRKYNGSYDK